MQRYYYIIKNHKNQFLTHLYEMDIPHRHSAIIVKWKTNKTSVGTEISDIIDLPLAHHSYLKTELYSFNFYHLHFDH